MNQSAIFAIASLAIVFTAGCAANRRDEPFTPPPDVSSDAKLRQGQIVFYQNCAVCHPGGSAGYGPSLNGQTLPAWYVRLRVRGGFGAMPAFDHQRLSDQNLDDVAYYLGKLHGL